MYIYIPIKPQTCDLKIDEILKLYLVLGKETEKKIDMAVKSMSKH